MNRIGSLLLERISQDNKFSVLIGEFNIKLMKTDSDHNIS